MSSSLPSFGTNMLMPCLKLKLFLFFVRYVSIGDIARVGSHPPNVAAVYRNAERLFAFPVGYDLVRNQFQAAGACSLRFFKLVGIFFYLASL